MFVMQMGEAALALKGFLSLQKSTIRRKARCNSQPPTSHLHCCAVTKGFEAG